MRGVRDEVESVGLDCKKFLLASLRNSTGFGRCGYEALVFRNEEVKGWPVWVGGIDALLFNVHGIELNVYALIIVEIVEHPSCNVFDVR